MKTFTPSLTRRQFLNTAFAASGAFAFPQLLTRPIAGATPTNAIRIGVIGTGGQGTGDMKSHLKSVTAVCDVDKTHLAAAVATVEKASGRKPAAYADYRELLESKEVDAVIIATPDHWHALPAIHACMAGKDVYCEKPLTLTIREGQVMVQAARKYNRVVQTGSQQRSSANFRLACELVRSGRLGKIHTVRVGISGVNFKGPARPDGAPPPELDYDRWLGPAPQRPYNVNRVHYNFRFYWDYSGGQLTNWGAHHLDIAQWGLGMDESGPVEIEGQARFHKENWYEVPEWSEITYKYANGITMICGQSQKGGTTFEGEKGKLFVNRGKLESDPAEIIQQPIGEKDVRLVESSNHHANWLECIRSRQRPICDVAIGHRSATVCHLGNIAMRTGRKIQWDPVKEQIVGDAEIARWVHRPYRAPWVLPDLT